MIYIPNALQNGISLYVLNHFKRYLFSAFCFLIELLLCFMILVPYLCRTEDNVNNN